MTGRHRRPVSDDDRMAWGFLGVGGGTVLGATIHRRVTPLWADVLLWATTVVGLLWIALRGELL